MTCAPFALRVDGPFQSTSSGSYDSPNREAVLNAIHELHARLAGAMEGNGEGGEGPGKEATDVMTDDPFQEWQREMQDGMLRLSHATREEEAGKRDSTWDRRQKAAHDSFSNVRPEFAAAILQSSDSPPPKSSMCENCKLEEVVVMCLD